jgi:hypothetical protein
VSVVTCHCQRVPGEESRPACAAARRSWLPILRVSSKLLALPVERLAMDGRKERG